MIIRSLIKKKSAPYNHVKALADKQMSHVWNIRRWCSWEGQKQNWSEADTTFFVWGLSRLTDCRKPLKRIMKLESTEPETQILFLGHDVGPS